MQAISYLIDLILHVDKHLVALAAQYGSLTYLILFLVVFCETGLVVTPFLPGDSLLFAAGAIATKGALDPFYLTVLLIIAAIIGDGVNYHVGRFVGPKVFSMKDSRIFKPSYLEKTQAFYEKYGGKAIIFARFVPIVRTFAPFLAGVGVMTYGKFLLYNVIGAVIWVTLFVYAGYFFGTFPFVEKDFKLVILAIIIISVLPPLFEYVKVKRNKVA